MDDFRSKFGFKSPVGLAAPLAAAVKLLNEHGFVVVPMNRVRPVRVGGAIGKPPEDTPEEAKRAHWLSVWQHILIKLVIELNRRKLIASRAYDDPAHPEAVGCYMEAMIIAPPGVSAPLEGKTPLKATDEENDALAELRRMLVAAMTAPTENPSRSA